MTNAGPGDARVWNKQSSRGWEYQSLTGSDRPESAQFSADGTRILTLGSFAKVWERQDTIWTTIAVFGDAESATFFPDGRQVLIKSNDGKVGLWNIPKHQELIDWAKKAAVRCPTIDQSYLLRLDYPEWCVELRKWPVDNEWITVHPREAVAAYERLKSAHPFAAASRFPDIADAYNDLAFDAFAGSTIAGKPTDDLSSALIDADKALALRPGDRNMLNTRGHIRLAMGRVDEAFADLNSSITLGNQYPGTYYARGKAYELKSNRPAAIADYRTALEPPPDGDGEYGSSLDYLKYARDQARERLRALGVGDGLMRHD